MQRCKMNIITLTKVGELDKNWIWNNRYIVDITPFHPFLNFKPYDVVEHTTVNADMILELKEGIPTIYTETKKYVKRSAFIEFFLGKKYVNEVNAMTFKDKITWVQFCNGTSCYVAESIEYIKKELS